MFGEGIQNVRFVGFRKKEADQTYRQWGMTYSMLHVVAFQLTSEKATTTKLRKLCKFMIGGVTSCIGKPCCEDS